MADNRIELVAQLNTVESEKVIQGQLDNMKNLTIKVKCDVDMSSIKSLQAKLSNLSTNISAGAATNTVQIIDKKAVKSDVDAIIETFDLAASKLNIKKNELRAMLSQPIADFKTAFATNDYPALEAAWLRLTDIIQKSSKEIYSADEVVIQSQNELRDSIRDLGKVSIDKKSYEDLISIAGSASQASQMMSSVFGVGNWTKSDAVNKGGWLDALANQIPQLAGESNNLADRIAAIYNFLSEKPPKMGVFDSIIAESGKVSEAFNTVLTALKLPLDEWTTTADGKLLSILPSEPLDIPGWQEATKQVNEFDAAVTKTSNDLKNNPPQIAVGGSTNATLESAKNAISEFYKAQEAAGGISGTVERVKKATEDTSGSLQRFFVQVERGDNSIETLTYALNEQGTAYEYLGKVIREADNSTAFMHKDVDTQWNEQAEKVRGFEADLKKAGLTSEELKTQLANLKAQLETRGDNNALRAFLKDFDLLKASAMATRKEMAATNDEMRKADAITSLGNRIKNNAAALEAWGNANRKATVSTRQISGEVGTYADKFAELTRRMNEYKMKAQNGTLAPADIQSFKHLTEEVNAYKKQAESAGLTTSKFFTNMASQLRMVIQRWVGLYAMINYIRKMVEEVKALDTAMINLKRVTNETEESYARFLKSATANAAALKTTTSSIVEQSYQWAKLGYSMNEALELANASTIYMRVGDVDQSQALSNLVTSLKAFKLEAKDTMGVVDRLDKLNNEFAVSASGLGQGLERSASAMAMTGNSLDQTLALLTGAGEITQNLENTGNALRVVALRLQNMKGKLEELNEPVDDLMEVSKVQTQILNLTGNRVDIFDSATQQFRSTYDILKDISEVWDSLTSVNRASLTEILFGKNRANTGLAIIQAFQSGQIESAFEASMDSMGTAVEENERLMQGLQAQLDALKGSFQNLANTALRSSFLKTILQSAGSLLDVLTKIVDTVGALPPLLGAIGAIAGAKGLKLTGLDFGTVAPQIKTASAAIQEYNVAMSQMNTVSGYQAVIARTVGGEVAANDAVFKSYITSLNGAKASVSGYVSQLVAAKVKTVALQAATMAMNAVLSMGIGLAISLAISAISKLIRAEEEERQKQEELREEYAKTAKERKQEVKSLNDALANYTKISATVTDVADREKQLTDLQDSLIDKFGEKAKALDLVNEKYSEGIEKIQQYNLAEAEEYVDKANRTGSYEKAKNELATSFGQGISRTQPGYMINDENTTRVMTEHWFAGIDDAFRNELSKYKNVWVDSGVGDDFYITGTLEQQRDTLKAILDYYNQRDDVNEKTRRKMNEQIDALDKQIQQDKLIVQQYEAAQKLISDLKLPEETQKQFNDLVAQAKEFNDIATGDGSIDEKFEAVQEIDKIQAKLYELAGSNETIRGTIKTVFSEFITGSKTGVQAVEDLTAAWYENLEELKKGTIKEIDSVKTALQTVAGGGTISASDFWDLSKIDTDHILDGAKMVGDQFQLTEEQLIRLKDTYIKKQIESLQILMETEKVKQQDALTEAALYQNQLNNWKFAEKNLNNPAYRKEYNTLKANLQTATDNAKQYGETWRLNNTLLMYYNSQLGNTVDRQKQLTDLTKKLQDEADNLLKAQEYRIDQIIDKFEDEKEAIEDAKSVLEDQLSVLEEQESALKDTIENYKSVAELVQETIQDQIDAIKEQNEAREESLDLAQKLANLKNARNNKVRVYTEAGGWQYEAKKSDVQKAERELEKAKTDNEIKELEKYLKKWQSLGDKAKKEADERLAVEILGANWREKISVQDEEIFNKYEQEYDAYGAQLWNISNIEIATVKKSIEVKNQEIAAKEAQIKEWQKYKSEVQKAANDAKSANESYMQYLSTVEVNEKSSLTDRANNLSNFATKYGEIMKTISGYNQEINSISSAVQIDTRGIEKAAFEMGEFIERYRDGVEAMAAALDESSNNYGVINSAWDEKLYKAAQALKNMSIPTAAEGRSVDYTGLLAVHGTKQRAETIFNANDSAKLYDLVHSTPNLVATALTDGASIARGLTNTSTDSHSVTLNGTTINLPNVQNAEQFARQFEAYMQTLLSESQVYKPSR